MPSPYTVFLQITSGAGAASSVSRREDVRDAVFIHLTSFQTQTCYEDCRRILSGTRGFGPDRRQLRHAALAQISTPGLCVGVILLRFSSTISVAALASPSVGRSASYTWIRKQVVLPFPVLATWRDSGNEQEGRGLHNRREPRDDPQALQSLLANYMAAVNIIRDG